MIVKTICAKAGEGKTRELISEVLFAKGNILIISEELTRTNIRDRLILINSDIDRIFVSESISESIITEHDIKTVLLDIPSRIEEMDDIIKMLESTDVIKVVYTIHQNKKYTSN